MYLNLINICLQVSLEDFLESCRAPALLTELEDDDEADDALDSDKENEPTYQEVVSIATRFYFYFLFLINISIGDSRLIGNSPFSTRLFFSLSYISFFFSCFILSYTAFYFIDILFLKIYTIANSFVSE